MDIFDNSIFKWNEPKSYYEYQETKIKAANPKWRWILGRYIIPIFGPFIIFAICSYIFKSLKFLVFGALFVVIGLLIPLIQKFKKRTIRIYDNKLSIYEDDVRKKDIKFKKIKSFNLKNVVDGKLSFDFLMLQPESGEEVSFVLDPNLKKDDLELFLKEKIVNHKSE